MFTLLLVMLVILKNKEILEDLRIAQKLKSLMSSKGTLSTIFISSLKKGNQVNSLEMTL